MTRRVRFVTLPVLNKLTVGWLVMKDFIRTNYKIAPKEQKLIASIPDDMQDMFIWSAILNLMKLLTNETFKGKNDSKGRPYEYRINNTGDHCFLERTIGGKKMFGIDRDKNGKLFCYSEAYTDPLQFQLYISNILRKAGELVIPGHYPSYYKEKKFQDMLLGSIRKLYLLDVESSFIEAHPEKFVDLCEASGVVKKYSQGHKKVIPVDLDIKLPPANIMQNILQDNSGAVIGNSHDDCDTIYHLCENMALLKESGVQTLFIEVPCGSKAAFDAFNDPKNPSYGKLKDLNKNMASLGVLGAETLPKEHYEAVSQLYLAANKAGIKVVPVDQPFVARNLSEEGLLERRMRSSDSIMAYNIAQYCNENEGKFVYLCGFGHSMVAEKLNVPMVTCVTHKRANEMIHCDFGIAKEGSIAISAEKSIPFKSDIVIEPPKLGRQASSSLVEVDAEEHLSKLAKASSIT